MLLIKKEIPTSGHANFNRAVLLAFEALNDSNECYKTMVVFTDGDADHGQLSETVRLHNHLNEVEFDSANCICRHFFLIPTYPYICMYLVRIP